jgi:hypothetical protein
MFAYAKPASRLARSFLPLLLALPLTAMSGQSMKCVDGSGRVVFTELDSCAEALRQNPAPIKPKSRALIESEQRIQKAQEMQKFYQDRAARIRSDARKRVLDSEYRERQQLRADDEQREKDCAAMLIESDQRYNDAMSHGRESWWQNRSDSFDQQMELKCGHETRLRR